MEVESIRNRPSSFPPYNTTLVFPFSPLSWSVVVRRVTVVLRAVEVAKVMVGRLLSKMALLKWM